MLKNLSERIRLCYERAAEARDLAEGSDPEAQGHLLVMERRWLLLARSYEFGERLDDFVPVKRPPQTAPAVGAYEVQAVLNATPFLLARCTSDFRYAFVSEEYARMSGRRPDDMVGKKVVEIIGEQGFETILPHVKAALAGQRAEYEAYVHFNGLGRRLLHVINTPDKDRFGNVHGWIASIMDITEKREAEVRIASDLAAMSLLRDVGEQCLNPHATLDECLYKVLDAAIALTGADKGNLQIWDSITGSLRIAAQRGFDPPFLTFFGSVHEGEAAASGVALKASSRVIIEDVLASDVFVGKPSLEVLLKENVRAVTSTPLMCSGGMVLGMVSTHFSKRHSPADRELHFLDLLARQAADYLERRGAQEREKLLLREVQHRSNNLLAVIHSIAQHSLSGDIPLKAAKEAFEGRLIALSRANKHVTGSDGGVRLNELIALHLQPFRDRISVDGPSVALQSKAAQDISLLLHELCTNAAKYGALSNQNGNVAITWSLVSNGEGRALNVRWRERDGPLVAVPTRSGFGTSLLKATFRNVKLDYNAEGLNCEIELPSED